MKFRFFSFYTLAVASFLVHSAVGAEQITATGVGISHLSWTCDLDGTAIGSLRMHGSSYDIAGLDGAALGSGSYRKAFETITILDGPLADLYGIGSGIYGTKAAEELMLFYGTGKRKLTCRGSEG